AGSAQAERHVDDQHADEHDDQYDADDQRERTGRALAETWLLISGGSTASSPIPPSHKPRRMPPWPRRVASKTAAAASTSALRAATPLGKARNSWARCSDSSACRAAPRRPQAMSPAMS